MSPPWTRDVEIASTRRRAPNFSRSTLAVASYLVFASLALLVLYSIAFTGTGSRFNELVRAKMCNTTIHHGSPTAAIQSSSAMTFHSIEQLEDLSYANDEAWAQAALTRPGEGIRSEGLLWVKYNETYSIPWGVSMFHALHCLQMIRRGVQAGPYGETLDVGNLSEQSTQEHHNMDPTHFGHCFGYIAQVSSWLENLFPDISTDVAHSIYSALPTAPSSHHLSNLTPMVT